MSDGNDETGGEGGGDPSDGRHSWPADYRVAFAELLVKFKELEGRMSTTEERFNTARADNRYEFERLGTRLTFVMMGVGGLVLAALGVIIALMVGVGSN